jgi:hypothetical protein
LLIGRNISQGDISMSINHGDIPKSTMPSLHLNIYIVNPGVYIAYKYDDDWYAGSVMRVLKKM